MTHRDPSTRAGDERRHLREQSACSDYRSLQRRGSLSRRGFLAAGAAAGASLTVGRPLFGASPTPGSTRDILVSVFLRGGLDGLSLLAPTGDATYQANRSAILLGTGDTIGLADALFRLNTHAGALTTPYLARDLAFVAFAGHPHESRSHFEKMDWVESGKDPADPLFPILKGWHSRHMDVTLPISTNNPLRAVSLEGVVQKSLAGAVKTLPIPNMAGFTYPGSQAMRDEVEIAFQSSVEPLVSSAQATFDSIDYFQNNLPGGTTSYFNSYTPSNGAVYPDGSEGFQFGNSMKEAAALIKGGLDTEILTLDFGGWDDHANLEPKVLPPPGGQNFANRIRHLANAMEAFYVDMGVLMSNVIVFVHSEFGRRLDENGSLGVDHGYGNVAMIMGGGAKGGVYRNGVSDLVVGNGGSINAPGGGGEIDLDIQFDFRDVMFEILQKRLQFGGVDIDDVFPNKGSFIDHGILKP